MVGVASVASLTRYWLGLRHNLARGVESGALHCRASGTRARLFCVLTPARGACAWSCQSSTSGDMPVKTTRPVTGATAPTSTAKAGAPRQHPGEAIVARHVDAVAGLIEREKRLELERAGLRKELDHALRAARSDGVQHLLLAIGICERRGLRHIGAEAYRVEQALRQRLVVASKRVSAPDALPAGNQRHVPYPVVSTDKEHVMSTKESPAIKSKTVTTVEYFQPGADAESDHDLDEDVADDDDDDAPPPAPATRGRARR